MIYNSDIFPWNIFPILDFFFKLVASDCLFFRYFLESFVDSILAYSSCFYLKQNNRLYLLRCLRQLGATSINIYIFLERNEFWNLKYSKFKLVHSSTNNLLFYFSSDSAYLLRLLVVIVGYVPVTLYSVYCSPSVIQWKIHNVSWPNLPEARSARQETVQLVYIIKSSNFICNILRPSCQFFVRLNFKDQGTKE